MGLLSAAGSMIAPSLAIYTAASDYSDKRKEGMGKLSSFAYAAGNAAVANWAPGLYWGGTLLQAAPTMAWEGYKFQRDFRRNLGREQQNTPFGTAHFMDSQQAFTMRQAGMAIAQQSNYATQRAMLGNEARFMAR